MEIGMFIKTSHEHLPLHCSRLYYRICEIRSVKNKRMINAFLYIVVLVFPSTSRLPFPFYGFYGMLRHGFRLKYL